MLTKPVGSADSHHQSLVVLKRNTESLKSSCTILVLGIITLLGFTLVALGITGFTAHQLPLGFANAFNTLGNGGCGALVACGTLISSIVLARILCNVVATKKAEARSEAHQNEENFQPDFVDPHIQVEALDQTNSAQIFENDGWVFQPNNDQNYINNNLGVNLDNLRKKLLNDKQLNPNHFSYSFEPQVNNKFCLLCCVNGQFVVLIEGLEYGEITSCQKAFMDTDYWAASQYIGRRE